MKDTSRVVLVAGAAGLIGALLGGAGVYAVQQDGAGSTGAAEARIAALESKLEEEDRALEGLTEKYNALRASSPTSVPASPTEQAPAPRPVKNAMRQFAYIESIDPGQKTLVADFAQYLTGDDAADAAAKAGDESPPPNDYYIVNENPKLRTLKIAPDATVRLTTKPGQGSIAEGYSSSLKKLAAYLETDNEETIAIQADGYWLTLEGGVITAIEEQYQP